MSWARIGLSSSVTERVRAHYGQVRESDAYRDLDIGSIAELAREHSVGGW